MTEPHDWPFERRARGTLRPWFFAAVGYVAVLFGEEDEARQAVRGLAEHGIAPEEMRLYTSEDVLVIVARLNEERSALAKAVAALTADPGHKQRYLDNAKAGGAALWLLAPTEDRANRLFRILADYNYRSLRYFGDARVEEVVRDPD